MAKSIVFVSPVGGVGIEDRLAERAGTAVGRVRHAECREQRAVFHELEAGPETGATGVCGRLAVAGPMNERT